MLSLAICYRVDDTSCRRRTRGAVSQFVALRGVQMYAHAEKLAVAMNQGDQSAGVASTKSLIISNLDVQLHAKKKKHFFVNCTGEKCNNKIILRWMSCIRTRRTMHTWMTFDREEEKEKERRSAWENTHEQLLFSSEKLYSTAYFTFPSSAAGLLNEPLHNTRADRRYSRIWSTFNCTDWTLNF